MTSKFVGNKGSKLPKESPADSSEDRSAYETCLALEENLENAEKTGKDVGRELIYCRILGYLFHHPPGNRALSTIGSEILFCEGNREKLLSLGKMYCDHLLCPLICENNPDHRPPSFPSSPIPSEMVEVIKEVSDKIPQDHPTATKKALVRDGFRCAVTRDYDQEYTWVYKELEQALLVQEGYTFPTITQGAYIFDESITPNIQGEGADGFWGILSRFGNEELSDELSGDRVHRLENMITLKHAIRGYFHSLSLWFVETDKPHNYILKATPGFIQDQFPKYVTFTSPDENKFPLPCPDYLRIHAACCEVAYHSGATQYLKEFFIEKAEMEDLEMGMADIECD